MFFPASHYIKAKYTVRVKQSDTLEGRLTRFVFL